MEQNFLFGYGSLINYKSREQTGRSGQATPVEVEGIARSWSLVYPPYEMTAMGAVSSDEGRCNGVLVPIESNELPAFDERELVADYERVRLDDLMIHPWGDEEVPRGIYWAYVATKPGKPSESCPLAQSYIDVILAGCLGFDEEFARRLIETTSDWSGEWVNDRNKPRYPRAQALPAEELELIDRLLEEMVPDFFKKRTEI